MEFEIAQPHNSNNRDDIAKHLKDALNALAVVSSDLDLHDNLAKQMGKMNADKDLGAIIKHSNTEGDFHQNDGALALGVVRAGRTDKIYRPHVVY